MLRRSKSSRTEKRDQKKGHVLNGEKGEEWLPLTEVHVSGIDKFAAGAVGVGKGVGKGVKGVGEGVKKVGKGVAKEAKRGKKTRLLRHFYIKTIILPRQARDRHKENSKKNSISLQKEALSTLSWCGLWTEGNGSI